MKRILVVDDDPSVRDFLSVVIGSLGYTVIAASSGVEALEQMQQHPSDAVFLDLEMPVMDGWEFARTYRQRPGPHAPIVVITAAENAVAQATQINADGYLGKPFELSALRAVIDKYLARPG